MALSATSRTPTIVFVEIDYRGQTLFFAGAEGCLLRLGIGRRVRYGRSSGGPAARSTGGPVAFHGSVAPTLAGVEASYEQSER